MSGNILAAIDNERIEAGDTIPLFESEQHSIYWVGSRLETEEIPCNTYLMVDEGEGYLFDPGGLSLFKPTYDKVESVLSAFEVGHILLSHQDPDVSASLPSWLEFNPDLAVVCSHLWNRFMPHYMAYNINYKNMGDDGLTIPLKSGGELKCISAPYLHSPGNMVVFDTLSGFMLSGDIGAAAESDDCFHLVIDDWQQEIEAMQGFHQRYMGSTRAAAKFVKKVSGLPITAILPQHGHLFRGDEVQRFLQWFEVLPCGVDFLYPEE
ncbi:MAG: MBL fold metallo-hydrolase [Desulfobacterales bacterium]